MVTVAMRLPVSDSTGLRFPEEHHAQFLDYVCGVFLNPRFEPSLCDQRELLFEVDGGILSRGGDVRGLIYLAKAHYRGVTVQVSYLGESETF